MRIPGFLHRKSTPQSVEFTRLNSNPPLELSAVVAGLELPTSAMVKYRGWVEKKLEDVVEGGRNNAVFACACAGLGRNLPLEFLRRVLIQNSKGLAESEIDEILHNAAAKPRSASNGTPDSRYPIVDGRFTRVFLDKEGEPASINLTNFTASISSEISVTTGQETFRTFQISGILDTGENLAPIMVPTADFSTLNWITEQWGSRPIIFPSAFVRDHLRCAIQLNSTNAAQKVVFGHTGWIKQGSESVFLHAGGAIGKDGAVPGVEVQLPDALALLALPVPASEQTTRDAIVASMSLLDFVPDEIGFPVLSATYRAPLGAIDFSLHLLGSTGVGKSEVASLAQAHFGQKITARTLPAAWSGTGNALEVLCSLAKDVLLVVDDFAPSGASADVNRSHRDAERLLRAQGNSAGRLRLRADATIRAAKVPRGLILSTGEDTPRGQSIRARMLLLEVSQGAIDFSKLANFQTQAQQGVFATAMSSYLRWLAPQIENIAATIPARVTELRKIVGGIIQGHARTSDIAANLLVGFHYFLNFAQISQAINLEQKQALWARALVAMIKVGVLQLGAQDDQEPADRFLRLLGAVFTSGRAHLASVKGSLPPQNCEFWGWFRSDPRGGCVGWLSADGRMVFLDPEPAYTAVQQVAQIQGEPIAIQQRALHSRLAAKGYLAATESNKRGTLTVRRECGGAQRSVLVFHAETLRKPFQEVPVAPENFAELKTDADSQANFGRNFF